MSDLFGERVKMSAAPVFTVLRRTKRIYHESGAYVFWGGAYIPGRVGQIGHAVCFDLFGSPVYVPLRDAVVPNETSKKLNERFREWYWSRTLVDPDIWMHVRKQETNPLLLRLQAMKARKTAGLIRVARRRAA
jgi:hypothetical protein